MSLQLQICFNETDDLKQKARVIITSIADALASDRAYKKAKDDMETLKAELKQAEARVKDDFKKELEDLDDIKAEINEKKMIMSDLALSSVVKGEEIEITDSYDNVLEPIFSVKFKKTDRKKEKAAEALVNRRKTQKINKLARDIDKLSPAGKTIVKFALQS